VTSAAYAQLGGMPVLMITGQKPIKKSKQGRFQIVDIVALMKPITKYAIQIAAGDNIPSRVREAYRLAEEEKPGATLIELPEDIAEEATTDWKPLPKSIARRPSAEPKAVRAAVKAIESAKSPIIVIGAGANRKKAGRMLEQLVEKTGIPFLTTQMGKGVIDERHPKFVGCAALSAGDFVHRAVEASDCIINVGHDVIEKPPFFMKDNGVTVIHISTKTAEVDPVYFPQVEMSRPIATGISIIFWPIIRRNWNTPARWPRMRASRSSRRIWCSRCATPCRVMASSALITACTKSGSRADTAPTCPTRCCWTMRWRRWGRGCRAR
jgi:acetolactate synthase-1/2/3 large subunit